MFIQQLKKRLFSQPLLTNETLISKFDGGLLREYRITNDDIGTYI